MKRSPLILLLITGCAMQPAPQAQDKAFINASRPLIATQPQWPTVTMHILVSNLDTNAEYPDQWTNFWSFDALASMDATAPRQQWDCYSNVTLRKFPQYSNELGFDFTTNTPWINVMGQWRQKP